MVVEVENRNRHTSAVNCYAYLQREILLHSDGRERPVNAIEHKWRGYNHPNVTIVPTGRRKFDAFMIYDQRPAETFTKTHTDSEKHFGIVRGPGQYLLRYAVYSQNFTEATGDLALNFDGTDLDRVEFRQAKPSESALFDR